MHIFPSGSRPSVAGNPAYFTGIVWIDPVNDAPAPDRANSVRVSFAPGARTAWHTHPLGQTLHVLSGAGLVALRGAAPRRIRPGDTIWIPPGAEHWHGAGPDTGMVHLAIQERDGERAATWLEKVRDADYRRAPE